MQDPQPENVHASRSLPLLAPVKAVHVLPVSAKVDLLAELWV